MLHTFTLAVDDKGMGVGRIAGYAHTTMLHDIVDVSDVVLQFFRGLLQLSDVLLQAGIRLCQIRHVASCAIDGQQAAVVVANRYQLQLVVQFIALQEFVEGTRVVWTSENLRHIGRLQVVGGDGGVAHHVLDGHMVVDDTLYAAGDGM